MPSNLTLIQRLERVLIEIAESSEITLAQRLEATRQLAAVKRATPPRTPRKDKGSTLAPSTALGSK